MQLAKTSIRARIRNAPRTLKNVPRTLKAGKFIGYGMAALVPAMGLIGVAQADAPAQDRSFHPIEVSADVLAEMSEPASAQVDTVVGDIEGSDALGLIEDSAGNVIEELGSGGASYYGPNLAGNRTASGERFDPTELTAAHRTLPMGSKVKVSMGDKSVVVRINDRGPFHGNRVIDLSTAAAKKIGLFRRGTGTVTLQLLNG